MPFWGLVSLARLSEGVLLCWLMATLLVTFAGCLYVFLAWRIADYHDINYVMTILFFLYFSIIHSSLLFGIFQAHLGRKNP